jgi:SET domain-containing protein
MAENSSTGLCIPYTVRDTPDKGRGVFAEAPIRKGPILWRHVRGLYEVYDECSLKKFAEKSPHSEVVYELDHIFGLPEFPDYMIKVLDDGVLINHSRQPNVVMNKHFQDDEIPYNTSARSLQEVTDALLNERFSLIASQDVSAGDELTMDYNSDVEDSAYYDALCEQYDVSWPWL